MDIFERAKVMVKDLLGTYKRPELEPGKLKELHNLTRDLARKAGVERLPLLDDFQPA